MNPVESDTVVKTETREFSNSQADNLVTSEQFEQIDNADTAPKNITLTRMGDFYEAFGDEALELADKLNLTPTYKTVNGVKTAMVGFPTHTLEKLVLQKRTRKPKPKRCLKRWKMICPNFR